MMPSSIPQLATAMRKLHDEGFIASKSTGSQGVGKTLRAALNMSGRNNSQGSDLPIGVRIKARKHNASSRMSLFTESPDTTDSNISKGDLLRRHGNRSSDPDSNYDVSLYVNPHSPSNGFRVKASDGFLRMYTPTGQEYGKYSVSALREKFLNQYQYLLIASAARIHPEPEPTPLYHYNDATLYHSPDGEAWEEAFKNGTAIIEFRLACDVGEYDSPRDHGTAFRMRVEDVTDLYDRQGDLLDRDYPVTEYPQTNQQQTLVSVDHENYNLFQNVSQYSSGG